MRTFLDEHWFGLAIAMSLFWGLRSAFLMTEKPHHGVTKGRFIWADACPCLGIFFIASYQFLFNFIGSMAGWGCLHVLLVRVRTQTDLFGNIGAVDFFLFLFSVIGLTGHLPQTLYGFVVSVGKVGESLVNAATKNL